jgi:hypothetical protein
VILDCASKTNKDSFYTHTKRVDRWKYVGPIEVWAVEERVQRAFTLMAGKSRRRGRSR